MPFQSKKKSRYKQVKISRETFINQYIMSMNTGFKYIAVLIRNDEEIKPDIHIIMNENQEERFKGYCGLRRERKEEVIGGEKRHEKKEDKK